MDLNKTIQKVVVVEGYHDLAALKHIFPEIEVVITNGSEISDETLSELKILNEKRGLILLLDPDYQGERIRKIINNYVGETAHAFIAKDKCISKNKKKVGIEHAKKEDIIEALKNVQFTSNKSKSNITMMDLYDLELMGTKNAKMNRKILTENIGIGLCNGKTLLQKLHMFQYQIDDLILLMKR